MALPNAKIRKLVLIKTPIAFARNRLIRFLELVRLEDVGGGSSK